jgi:hypothetical protein
MPREGRSQLKATPKPKGKNARRRRLRRLRAEGRDPDYQ